MCITTRHVIAYILFENAESIFLIFNIGSIKYLNDWLGQIKTIYTGSFSAKKEKGKEKKNYLLYMI